MAPNDENHANEVKSWRSSSAAQERDWRRNHRKKYELELKGEDMGRKLMEMKEVGRKINEYENKI